MSEQADIVIKGARQHNLKNIDIAIPKKKLVVVTGVSGSGKSSLSIDTLFAEGQRRYAESLNSYVRQFISRLPKPDVDYIDNLCPAISIDQKVSSASTRSTVGTLTEIYDYLKVLYARIGVTYSPISNLPVHKDTVDDVWLYISSIHFDTKFLLLFPLENRLNDWKATFELLQRQGYTRVWNVNTKQILELDELESLKFKKSDSWMVVKDRGIGKKDWTTDDEARWRDGIESAFHEGYGECMVYSEDTIKVFSDRFERDGIIFEEPSPDFFSFNNSYGACKTCEGHGKVLGIDEDLVIPNRNLSVFDEAIVPWKTPAQKVWYSAFIRNAGKYNFPIHRPINQLSKSEYQLLWTGKQDLKGIDDFFDEVQRNLYKIQYRVLISRYRGRRTCPDCHGSRIRYDALYVKIANKSIDELLALSVKELFQWFTHLELTEYDKKIASRLLEDITHRLLVMNKIGLSYLSLNRSADTLSGGESQRIHLTRLLGSNLSESLYVLDEPSIGLHPRDTENLVLVLHELKELGNTVVVVEHEEQVIRQSDYLIDVGPGAGIDGGRIVAEGPSLDVIKQGKSLTAKYLNGELRIHRSQNLKETPYFIALNGAESNNLKNIDVQIPLNRLTTVCGVSGSGKSTLMKDILYPAISQQLGNIIDKPGRYSSLTFPKSQVSQIEFVDQNPIGKSSRSNPITYIKAFDDIRKLYSNLKLAKIRGYKPGHFSFNTDGGRCDVCKGEGEIIVKMQFLADIHLECEECHGKQFKEDVLEVKYQGKNIHELLQMTVDEAVDFFEDDKKIQQKIMSLKKVGLGYMHLGQSSSTLSGGEAQRVKLATYLLDANQKQKVVFIFDEPTTGLHFHDIQTLLNSFNELLSHGHTIILIEHNLDVIRESDYVIELGPVGGIEGGHLLYQGDVAGMMKSKKSITAPYLS